MPVTVLQKELGEVELTKEKFDKYLLFMKEIFEFKYKPLIEYITLTIYNEAPCLYIRLSSPQGYSLETLLIAKTHPLYSISSTEAPPSLLQEIANSIEYFTYFFAETGGKGHVYFIYVPGQSIVPLRQATKKHKMIEKLFFENMIYLFVLSMIISFLLYLLVYLLVPLEYLPVAIILAQSPLLILAPKIIELLGDWIINEKHPIVVIVDISLNINEYENFVKNIFNKYKYEIKTKIFHAISQDFHASLNKYKVSEILKSYGASIDPDFINIRVIDLYSIVSNIFKKYRLAVPKIILSNIIVPNAAASGILTPYSVLLITSGLLVKLTDNEISAVIGHEASHLKNKDPLLFYILSSAEYLTRLYLIAYVLWPLLIRAGLLLELLYLYFSLTALFFVAKFLEARADIEAAAKVGSGDPLASALKKIGFRRLIRETRFYGRARSWLLWDPHPPVSFRIELLRRIRVEDIKNPWIFSIVECTKDFIQSVLS